MKSKHAATLTFSSALMLTLPLLTQPMLAHAAEVVVEAGGPGTSSTGTWRYASGASMDYNGNRGMYAITQGEDETYTFTPNLPETNTYDVQVYNSCYSPRSHQVTHYIYHAAGTDTHIVEQDCDLDPYVGQWRTLGSYAFVAGTESSVVIDTRNSDNAYVGATAVRFVYTPGGDTGGGVNVPPVLSLSDTAVTVIPAASLTLSAVATDVEDGDISQQVQWIYGEETATGSQLQLDNITASQEIRASITDSAGASSTASVAITVENPQAPTVAVHDFCGALAPLPGFVTNNPSALPEVGMQCGRYVAKLYDNTNDITLHYHDDQGRFDGVPVTFPFDVIARNVGTAPMDNPTQPHITANSAFTFAGLQIHHEDLDNLNSVHMVVGQRGNVRNTVEGKMTRNGESVPGDIGSVLPRGRADLRIVGAVDGTILAYWQLPNMTGDTANDQWIPYDGTGQLPGDLPQWDGRQVYVGLITYAYRQRGVPFMGVVDALEINDTP